MGNILVVFTGGTIGSQIQDNRISLRRDNNYPFLEKYEAKYPGKACFETAEPFRILSENLTPAYMAELVRFLKKKDINRYDGVIVAHGTDSLPYTAAYLGYYFGNAQVPVILVSSNYPLEEAGSNGQANFEGAVDFIREMRYAGVFVLYQNEVKEPVSVFLATRLLEADSYEDRFCSFDGGRLGRMEGGRFIYEERKTNPPLKMFLRNTDRGVDGRGTEWMDDIQGFSRVLKLHPYPGLEYDRIRLEKEMGAVFHGVYHSGTICMEGIEKNASLFVRRAEGEGISVYFGPVKKQEKQYKTVQEFILAGGIPVYDCSEIAAYVKLLIGCGLGKRGEELETFMSRIIYFEQIERR